MTGDPPFLSPELLLRAYRMGVFPMAEARGDPEVFWVDPTRRGVLPLDGFHMSRSLRRRIRKGGYSVTCDTDFAGVVAGCADREETWISHGIEALYSELHSQGDAHSLEVRDEHGRLIGGVYGVAQGAAFFGESMFSRRTDASKIALAHLVDHLRHTGFVLFDTQFLTPHLASLGGVELSRARYRRHLREALALDADFARHPPAATGQALLQRSTQTS